LVYGKIQHVKDGLAKLKSKAGKLQALKVQLDSDVKFWSNALQIKAYSTSLRTKESYL